MNKVPDFIRNRAVQPGPTIRGIATTHSAAPLNEYISGLTDYVWPYSKQKPWMAGYQPLNLPNLVRCGFSGGDNPLNSPFPSPKHAIDLHRLTA